MTRPMLTDRQLHPWARHLGQAMRSGQISRRAYMAMMGGLGVTVPTAMALGGLTAPARASDTPRAGGTLTIGMAVKRFTDPRAFDWPEIANVARQCNAHLVRWKNDFSFEGRLFFFFYVSEYS